MCVDSQRLLINDISALPAIHMNKELLWSKAAGLLQHIYDTTVKNVLQIITAHLL